MSEPQVDPSGINQNPTGGSPEGNEPKRDLVAYETYQKAVDEAKKAKERARKLEADAKEREEADLRAKEDYKKIAELREQEAKAAKEELALVKAREQNAVKLDAFLSTLDGKVDRKFWGHINLSQILIDPETGDVDQMSVAKEVDRFRKEYFEIIQKPGQNQLPNAAPQPGGVQQYIAYDEWKKLPLKEQKARYAEMREGEKIKAQRA